MRINIKNFNNDTRKIVWERNEIFLTLFCYKKENGYEIMDRVFIKYMASGITTSKALKELIQRAEKHYGINLLKPEFKLEQIQQN